MVRIACKNDEQLNQHGRFPWYDEVEVEIIPVVLGVGFFFGLLFKTLF